MHIPICVSKVHISDLRISSKMRPVPVLRPLRHQRESLKVWVSWDVKILLKKKLGPGYPKLRKLEVNGIATTSDSVVKGFRASLVCKWSTKNMQKPSEILQSFRILLGAICLVSSQSWQTGPLRVGHGPRTYFS
jgi:hypothetical protein